MDHGHTLLGRRGWGRLERSARAGHDRDLHLHLRELAERRPSVLNADASWMSGVVSLQLSGHRLLLGGVAPHTAWDVLAMAFSASPIELTKAGRYGPFWWIAIRGTEERIVLARQLQLHHDPRRDREAKLHLPVLSGAY